MLNRRSLLIGLCLGVVCLAAYLANSRLYPAAGDVMSTRLIPFALLGWGTLTLEPFRDEFMAQGPLDWFVQDRGGSLVSLFPVGAAVVALPVYIPCYLWLRAHGHDSPLYLFKASPVAEKLAASAIASLCVAVLFLLLCRRLSARTAAAVALAFGLGTSMWTISSQNLWQHGPGVLCLLLGMLALELPRSGSTLVAAGLFLGMAVAVRPQNGLFLAAAAAYLWVRGESRGHSMRAVLRLALGSLLPLAAMTAYNLRYYHILLGGYGGLYGQELFTRFIRPTRLLQGFSGLLLSPNRGLLMFSPVVVLGCWGMARALRRWRSEPLLAAFSGAALAYALLHASFTTWWGGWCFGPRFLTETLPVLAVASSLVVPSLSAWGRAAALLLAAWSILIQLVGAVCYPASSWDARMMPRTKMEAEMWDYRHLEVLEDFQTWLAQRAHRLPPRAMPLPDSACRVEWKGLEWGVAEMVTRTLQPTERLASAVTFRNVGDRVWPDAAATDAARSGVNAVRLTYRWRRGRSWVGPYEGRADLREPLPPGQATTVQIVIVAPAEEGIYELQFDLIQEGFSAFAERGAQTFVVPVRVSRS
ncbi:MAG TPA: hypothetical protein VOA80_01505 [Thermoanaerobaculia bacterium]|nr:hypothetical protein [Thermoanaerobaculia bacterium]